jgi:hypothetical protein
MVSVPLPDKSRDALFELVDGLCSPVNVDSSSSKLF